MSDRTEFTAEDEAAEQLGIKVALARQELVAACCSASSVMLSSGVDQARGDERLDWDELTVQVFEAVDQAAKELVEALKGTE